MQLEPRAVKVMLAYAAYKSDTVRLADPDLRGFTHIVASRQGLYAVNPCEWRLLAHGFFFGITFRANDIFVFECCDMPRGPTRMGRIVQFTVRDQQIVATAIIARGLDNGCHQIDFIDDRLLVVDTYNQQLLRFAPDLTAYETLHPLPLKPASGWHEGDPHYVHVNSLLAVGQHRLLLLHNLAGQAGRQSQIALCDLDWTILEKITVDGTGCHGLALLPDGTLLTTGSMQGRLIATDGFAMHASPFMTRGLAVGPDSIVVGASRWSRREGRMESTGTITFMTPQFDVEGVLMLPAAPTEVRRLDAHDAGLSTYLAGLPWGTHLKTGPAQ